MVSIFESPTDFIVNGLNLLALICKLSMNTDTTIARKDPCTVASATKTSLETSVSRKIYENITPTKTPIKIMAIPSLLWPIAVRGRLFSYRM